MRYSDPKVGDLTAMKAVTVREFENDPSAALREAGTDPVIVLNRNGPEAVLIQLSDDSLPGEWDVRLAIATALYRSESLSLGRAAEISGLPVAEFMRHVSRLGIPVIRGDAATLKEDMAAFAHWENASSRSSPKPMAPGGATGARPASPPRPRREPPAPESGGARDRERSGHE